jgi:hypothetical protein
MILQLAMVLGSATVKDTLESIAGKSLSTPAVPHNIKTLGQGVAPQAAVAVLQTLEDLA